MSSARGKRAYERLLASAALTESETSPVLKKKKKKLNTGGSMWRPPVREEIRTLTAFPLKWQASFFQPYAESELGNTSAAPAEGSDRRSHAEKMLQSGDSGSHTSCSEEKKYIWHLKTKHQPLKKHFIQRNENTANMSSNVL